MGQHIPQFRSREEEAKFWDTVNLTELAPDQMEVVEVERPDRPRSTTFALRLDERTVFFLRHIAKSSGLGPTQLARSWILERLTLELEAGQLIERQTTSYPIELERSLRHSIVHSLWTQIPAVTERVLNDVLERADIEMEHFTDDMEGLPEADQQREDASHS